MKSKSCSNERQRALPLLMTPPSGKQEPNRTECKNRQVHTDLKYVYVQSHTHKCKNTPHKYKLQTHRDGHCSVSHTYTNKRTKSPVATASLCPSFVPLAVKHHNPIFLILPLFLLLLPPAIILFHFSTANCLFAYQQPDNRAELIC